MRWRSAYFSYRAHWSELVNRSLPAHWLCRRVEESDCGGAPVGSNCRESAVLLLTCAAALSLTHWQSALYVWKWAIITIICVPSLVFYNGVIILFPCMMPFLPPSVPLLLLHFSVPSLLNLPQCLLQPSSFLQRVLPSSIPPYTSFTRSLIQMTGTGALLIMLLNMLRFLSLYHYALPNASPVCTP